MLTVTSLQKNLQLKGHLEKLLIFNFLRKTSPNKSNGQKMNFIYEVR